MLEQELVIVLGVMELTLFLGTVIDSFHYFVWQIWCLVSSKF